MYLVLILKKLMICDMKDLFFGCNSLKKLILSKNNVDIFKEKMEEKLPKSIEISII